MARAAPIRESDVLVRRRPRRWPFVLAAVALPVIAGLLDMWLVAMSFVLVGAIAFFLMPAMAIEATPEGDQLVKNVFADREGVRFGERLVLRREDVAAAGIEPLANGQFLLQLWGRRAHDDLALTFPDAERARKMLEALELQEGHHTACFTVDRAPLGSARAAAFLRAARLLGAVAITAAVCFTAIRHEMFGFALVPLLLAYFAGLKALRRKERIVLGSDALVIREPIPLSEVASCTGAGPRAELTCRDGRVLPLVFDSDEKRAAFATRLQASCGKADNVTHVERLVAPAADRDAWLDGLRRLRADSFRGPSVATEDLWRIVEGNTADAGARAGAAAALVPHLDEHGRIRLEALADGTAQTPLRAAFQAAAAEDATDEHVVAAFMEKR